MTIGGMRQLFDSYAIGPSDVRALVGGGKTDASLLHLRRDLGDRAAFEMVYSGKENPWLLDDPRYAYQDRKYRGIMATLPKQRFASALDIGCGLGGFAQHLTGRADQVLGMDIAGQAIDRARLKHADVLNLSFAQGDVFNLPAALDAQFDLITLLDVLYYAPQTSKEAFGDIAARMARLLRPGGLCVVVNHYFIWDEPTQLSRRIHAAFRGATGLRLLAQHWRPFYMITLFTAPLAS